jgi:hypothetical protein
VVQARVKECEALTVATLDDVLSPYLDDEAGGGVDALKMDVEGKECDVISGASRLLSGGGTTAGVEAGGALARPRPRRAPRFLRIEGTDPKSRKCVEQLARRHGYTTVWQCLHAGADLNLLLYRP